MTNTSIDWDPPPLSPDDRRLVDAYVQTGVPLDSLVYTDRFKDLVRTLGAASDDERVLRDTYLRLLALRKRSMLPRLYEHSTSAG